MADLKELINKNEKELLELIWESDKEIYNILKRSDPLQQIRRSLFLHLEHKERQLFSLFAERKYKEVNAGEKNNARECLRILKNIIRSGNEKMTSYSVLTDLVHAAKKQKSTLHKGLLIELLFLINGANCKSGVFNILEKPEFIEMSGAEASKSRSHMLDDYAQMIENNIDKGVNGLDKKIIQIRENSVNKILDFFKASKNDWEDYKWHLKNVISNKEVITKLVHLNEEELKGIDLAEKFNIPFQITPFYLSLFNSEGKCKWDEAIRAQVIPSINYCTLMHESKQKGIINDFMGEASSSPIKGITRRYPQIVILKIYDTCPQICIYCQRNWEITDLKDAVFSRDIIYNAIEWIKNNKNIKEVLVTGGDPLTLNDDVLKDILIRIFDIPHVTRVRFGSRTFSTLPMRITNSFVDMIRSIIADSGKEFCMVTHFEHATEITPEVAEAVKKIRLLGINIYNQQVFTYYNSKKFESAQLRVFLKRIGIDPYYSFNAKGKEETVDFRVPIARIEQERKEEARLLPGLTRTDEPVFNVPRLGKSHLRAWQDHEVIMLKKDGKRVYRFYPWESKYAAMEPYNYTDTSIYDYLIRLNESGENINEYSSIFYYF